MRQLYPSPFSAEQRKGPKLRVNPRFCGAVFLPHQIQAFTASEGFLTSRWRERFAWHAEIVLLDHTLQAAPVFPCRLRGLGNVALVRAKELSDVFVLKFRYGNSLQGLEGIVASGGSGLRENNSVALDARVLGQYD